MERKSILGSVVTLGSYDTFVDRIIHLATHRVPSYVCFANVHMVVEAKNDAAFRKVVNQATIVAPDGKPLSVFLKLFHNIEQDRVCGMDVMPDLLRRAEESGRSIYFYGGEQKCLDLIRKRAEKEFPNLKIAGMYSPPFRALSEQEKAEDVERIRESGADLVFVSLGCPRQEKWCAENVRKLNACFLALGQAFTVYAGLEKRLPKWMRALCLEWALRLVLEPRRLWRRYLYTNTEFLKMTAKFAITNYKARTSMPARVDQ
jgi:N-acetylglucosaminyldiphosphoundecaprenol N-acetyl-beta-D-mannosaminyltransferase